jgi:hypothetical protein
MIHVKRILWLILLLVSIYVTTHGCAAVKPYQREYLADPIMSFEANKEERMMERHFIETREGSIGGYGGAGGGCACN